MQDDPFADVPDWLKELQEPPSTEELLGKSADQPASMDEMPFDLRPQEPPSEQGQEEEDEGETRGVLDSLREQAIDELEELDRMEQQPRGGLAGILLGLSPMQRFALALLLFLDVVLLGCMCLVMTGRVVPF
jgi:hypothetical protein